MKDELLELLKEHAYRKGDFKLSSGKKSEHYVNCKDSNPVVFSCHPSLYFDYIHLSCTFRQQARCVGAIG